MARALSRSITTPRACRTRSSWAPSCATSTRRRRRSSRSTRRSAAPRSGASSGCAATTSATRRSKAWSSCGPAASTALGRGASRSSTRAPLSRCPTTARTLCATTPRSRRSSTPARAGPSSSSGRTSPSRRRRAKATSAASYSSRARRRTAASTSSRGPGEPERPPRLVRRRSRVHSSSPHRAARCVLTPLVAVPGCRTRLGAVFHDRDSDGVPEAGVRLPDSDGPWTDVSIFGPRRRTRRSEDAALALPEQRWDRLGACSPRKKRRCDRAPPGQSYNFQAGPSRDRSRGISTASSHTRTSRA
mmetsp:Transcript_23237/g.78488  ORF Transcript_23237/g.78488 Transcript_23237/m.78488 type:complete len:303 (+) Transcript_23237:154-1062(+)